jgi:MFS family permease
MSLLLLTFPDEGRAKAMSAWGAASILGGATGVLFGGPLTGYLGLSSVFLVTVPVSVAAVVLARRVLKDGARGARRRFDWHGAATITGAAIAVVHGAGTADRGWTSLPVVASFAGAALLVAIFVFVERRTAYPLVPLELFRSRTTATGVALAFLGGAARASTFVLVALYLQEAHAMAPQQAGLAMVPTSLTGFAASLVVLPRMLRAYGPQRSLIIGLVILAAGHLWLAHAPIGAGYLVAVLPGLLLVATGVALSFMPTTMVIASSVPATHAGLASGLAGSASQIGAALGTATFIAIGASAEGPSVGAIGSTGSSAAFTAAAVVAFATAVLGSTIARTRH